MISVTDPVSKVTPSSHHHAATITSMQMCPDDRWVVRTECAVTRTQTNVDTKLVIWHTPASRDFVKSCKRTFGEVFTITEKAPNRTIIIRDSNR